MKKNRFIIGCILAIATIMNIDVMFNNTSQDAHLAVLSQIEAMARGEGVGQMVCRCSKVTDQSCAVNNKGSVCASGDNIHCENWNLNCHKNI